MSEDVQVRLSSQRETAERVILEHKHSLYEIVIQQEEGWELKATMMANKIKIYEDVVEETWPIAVEGGIRVEPPKNPASLNYE